MCWRIFVRKRRIPNEVTEELDDAETECRGWKVLADFTDDS